MRWPLLAALIALPSDSPPVRLSGDQITNFVVEHTDFGGFSAIELSKDGRTFLALTDQGVVFAGRIDRSAAGQVSAIQTEPPVHLQDQTGALLGKNRNDTEGLALRDDGGFLVSLEGPAEVLVYMELGGRAHTLPKVPEWEYLGMNAGIEALAISPDGIVIAIPEQPQGNHYLFYSYSNFSWARPGQLSAEDNFRAVAADIGPDGYLYLLERKFEFPGGFASRLRRISSRMQDIQPLWTSPSGRFGNLEGLSIWMDPARGLTATMISDDNFLGILQTQLVEIVIGD